MATVITNLLSAIPVFGKDLVESNNTTNLYSCLLQVINQEHLLPVLTTIGTVSPHAKKDVSKTVACGRTIEEYLTIPYTFLAFFVGFIDGDGYIKITRTNKGHIAIKLVISLSIKDFSSLEYFYSILNLGKIKIYKDHLSPTCKFIINKTDLQEIIFPLLIHHKLFFLTDTRRAQFDLCMYILQNDIKYYKDIEHYMSKEILLSDPSKMKQKQLLTFKDYLKLPFFKNWLVGFTNAKGSFHMKKNKDGCYSLKQRIHLDLFEALNLFFDTKRTICIESDKYAQFALSSKLDVQKVIHFFSFSGLHPLIGLKYIQYLKWLIDLQHSSRYKDLNFPK